MTTICYFAASLTVLQFVIPETITNENTITNRSFEFNADNLHLLNDGQIQALMNLQEPPEYHSITIDPEAYMTMEEIIRYHGYPVETHTIQTEDGYILTIQRIPHGKNGFGTKSRKPVLIQHGFLCSSASWVTNVPDKNLPYLVAEAGYDVWLGNIRGTNFGRNHTSLSPEDKQFWKFNFDSLIKYDVTAVIDHILSKTGFKQIHYIGHSMGTMMMFALLSSQPKYNDIVVGFYALAPIVSVKNVKSPIKLLDSVVNQVKWLTNLFGTGEILPNNKLIKFFTSNVCATKLNFLCTNLIFVICGYNIKQLNVTRVPVHLHHTPAGTSIELLVHFSQMRRSDRFQKYDYGSKINKQLYRTIKPPKYDLKNIKTKVALFWSDNDILASPIDMRRMIPDIKNLVLKHRVPDPKFSHLDFLWAIDVKPLLYDKVISTMNKLWKD